MEEDLITKCNKRGGDCIGIDEDGCLCGDCSGCAKCCTCDNDDQEERNNNQQEHFGVKNK